MLDKTKAALQGRQWDHSKQNQHTRPAAGGQSQRAPVITGAEPSPEISRDIETAPLARLGFRVQDFRQWRGYTALPHTPKVIAPKLGRSGVAYLQLGQPLDSMPRCCNSLRIMRLIQAARDSSPSCCWACSISSRNSGSSLNWNGGLPRLSFLCVDTSITPDVMYLCVITHYTHVLQIATPRSAGTLPRRLTKPLYEVTVMADQQHTQTHPKFTWLFLATPKRHADVRPVIVRFNADTEEKARDAFPGWDLVFAAKIRSECPLYQYANGTFELNISGLEVRHA